MKSKLSIFAFVMLVFAGAALVVGAQQSAGLTETSYRRAREVLDAGQKALGVWGAKPGFDDISFKISGKLYTRNQSVSSEKTDSTPFAGEMVVDYAKNRIAVRQKGSFPGGFLLDNRVIWVADKGSVVQYAFRTVNSIPNPQAKDNALVRVPHVLLVRAYERANTLRWIGEAQFEGRKQNVIAFATAAGQQNLLYFDAASNAFTKWETLGTDPVAGDAVTEFVFSGWQTVGGVKFPTGQTQRVAGELAQDFQYSDIRVNSRPGDDAFAVPQDYAEAPMAPANQIRTQELGKDVWMVSGFGNNAYAPVIVAFNDYVMIIEPPLNEATSRAVLEKARELAPGKPVKYVAVTHHHSDHSGGARTYFAEGVTLVTTPGNVKFFQRMAAARFTMPPDGLQLNPRAPSIETIQNKKRVFTDGTHTVELYDIGPNPHANEMVVAWLPKERILYTGDLFARDPLNRVTPAIAATEHLAQTIEKLGLNVDKLVEVHSGVNTMADVRLALELARNGGQRAAQ